MGTSTIRVARLRAKRKSLGICIHCPSAVKPGRTLCPACCDKSARKSSEQRTRRHNRGVCIACNNKTAHGSWYCKDHQERKAQHRNNDITPYRREHGLCISCGRPLHQEMDDGYIDCTTCRQKYSRRRYANT